MDEILINDVGNTAEFKSIRKTKESKRIIILLIILLFLSAVIIIIILLLKGQDQGKDKEKSDSKKNYEVLMSDSQFIKPKGSNKKYELIQIKESKYKIFLFNDPKTLGGGIEIRANIGSDTDIIDGLSHYVEHIFFQGTEKITEYDLSVLSNQYFEFSDAYTEVEEIIFQFFGSNYTFETLLDYISQFIQKPALNKTKFITEINAINSEFDIYNYTDQTAYDILIENSNSEHGFSQTITAHTGNNYTLLNYTTDVLCDYIKDFFLTIFKPENCVILIYSSKSLEEMRNYAEKYFNFKLDEPTEEFKKLLNKKVQALDNPIFKKEQLGKFALYNKTRETPKLSFYFQISQNNNYINSIEILSYLFNDKKEGSLFKYLYEKNYICNIDFKPFYNFKKYQIINFDFHLTREGNDNIEKIMEALFASINFLKQDSNIGDFISNIKIMAEKKFKFKEEVPTILPDDIDFILNNFAIFGTQNLLGNPNKNIYDKKRVLEILEELSPDNCFITLDSPYEVDISNLNNQQILITRAYKDVYTLGTIPEDIINKLKKIKETHEYKFKSRGINEDYTKLEDLTEKPCYENKPNNCKEYKEFDIYNDSDLEPYVVENSEKIISLMKIDRSHGIPFIKGYIDIKLEEGKYNETIAYYENSKALLELIALAINEKFSQSTLFEAGSIMTISFDEFSKIIIEFSTFNDIINRVIKFIKNIFKESINESFFNNIKEKYYFSKANHFNDQSEEVLNDCFILFERFITLDKYHNEEFIPKEIIKNTSYSDFSNMFLNISKIKTSFKYLIYGDISIDLANSTTQSLSSLIDIEEIILKSNDENVVEIPENSSIYFNFISSNKYQRQGMTITFYEFIETIVEKVRMYTICANDFIYNYVRTERGSGYIVNMNIKEIFGKYYLIIFSLGKVYSPEKMDRLINEAIKESFTMVKCPSGKIKKYLDSKKNIKGFAQDKFEDLKSKLYPEKLLKNLKSEKDDEIWTYEGIVETVKEVVVNKPKKLTILYHRGDITEDELKIQNSELDKNYFLNDKIENLMTNDIKYLEKY